MSLESNISLSLLPFSRRAEPAQSRACFEGLVRQIPLLYLVVLANFTGMWLVTDPSLSTGMVPLCFLVGLVLWRLTHWLRLERTDLSIGQVRRAIRQTAGFALIISLGFAVWGQFLLSTRPDVTWLVVLFAGLASIGAAFGLMSFPLAAAIPIFTISLTLTARLLTLGQHEATIVGVCLALVSILILRILLLQNRAMQKMVTGRLELEAERRNLVNAERTAAIAARTDALTGLANRRAFMETLILHQESCGNRKFTLALIDLNGFKPINDIFGHNAGDAILQGIAHHLTSVLPDDVHLARMGGDEFAILAPHIAEAEAARKLGERVCSAIAQPVEFQGRHHQISASCGMVLTNGTIDVSTGLQSADQALYKAKESSCSLQIFDVDLQKETERRALVERLIITDAVIDQLHVVYQPILDLRQNCTVVAHEVLARWTNPELGDVGPAEFIPTAEGANAIAAISARCLELACRKASSVSPQPRLSFNLSAIELCDARMHSRILSILQKFRMAPERVQFEVTETAPLTDLQVARDNIECLRAAGCIIALDDFGAGNASITYLREMHFDLVKLDGSLIKGIVESLHCRQLLKATIDLCHTMGMRCVAEMIETSEQLSIIQAFGCDAAQGNFIARPSENFIFPQLLNTTGREKNWTYREFRSDGTGS